MTDKDPYVSSGAPAAPRRTLADQCIGETDEIAEIISQLAAEPVIFDPTRSDVARTLASGRSQVVHDAY